MTREPPKGPLVTAPDNHAADPGPSPSSRPARSPSPPPRRRHVDARIVRVRRGPRRISADAGSLLTVTGQPLAAAGLPAEHREPGACRPTRSATPRPNSPTPRWQTARKQAAKKAAAARTARRRPRPAGRAQATPSRGRGAAGAVADRGPPAASGSPQQIAEAMLGSFGWSSGQFSCLDPLWEHESGWSVTADNAGRAPTASRRHCPAPGWPAPDRTGRPTRPRRSSGAWSTSRTPTDPRAAPGHHEQATGWY